jgi:hypothetical protein
MISNKVEVIQRFGDETGGSPIVIHINSQPFRQKRQLLASGLLQSKADCLDEESLHHFSLESDEGRGGSLT